MDHGCMTLSPTSLGQLRELLACGGRVQHRQQQPEMPKQQVPGLTRIIFDEGETFQSCSYTPLPKGFLPGEPKLAIGRNI